jgi:DNA-directed RNA polymerase specialized sigma24 family protein
MHPVILEAARSGEHERFVSLYERHGGAVLAYARRRCCADEAEDVLAETFLVVWRRRRDVPADALP